MQAQSVIIRMPNWLGDLVMATGALEQIRHQFPQAHLAALCVEGLAPLLENDPRIDTCIPFKRRGSRMPAGLRRQLRADRYDLGILLTNSWSSAWWLWRGGVKQRRGYALDGRRLLLNQPRPLPLDSSKRHLVELYCNLVDAPATPPRLYVSDEELSDAQARITGWGLGGLALVAISPQAAYGPAKQWPGDRFRAVAQELLTDPTVGLVWLGDPKGRDEIDLISRDLPRSFNAAGLTTLRQLMSCLACSRLLLTNDSGPMHVASALGTPLVALFGPTNPQATRPFNGGTLLYKSVACSPCYRRTCPIDHRCMTQIGVKEVVESVRQQLVG